MKYMIMVARGINLPESEIQNLAKRNLHEFSYTLISDDYKIVNMSGKELSTAIMSKKASVLNMDVSNSGLMVTNGAASNYTTFVNGQLYGSPRAVILGRIEANGNLEGYIVYTATGSIVQASVADAAKLAMAKGIANGKIRKTDSGAIVSSISGTYPVMETLKKDYVPSKKTPTLEVGITLFMQYHGKGKSISTVSMVLHSDDARALTVLFNTAKKANTTLVEGLASIGYTDTDKKLEMSLASKGGFYGTYDLTSAMKIIESAGGKFSLPIGKVLISYLNIDENAEAGLIANNFDMDGIKLIANDAAEEDVANLRKFKESLVAKLKEKGFTNK